MYHIIYLGIVPHHHKQPLPDFYQHSTDPSEKDLDCHIADHVSWILPHTLQNSCPIVPNQTNLHLFINTIVETLYVYDWRRFVTRNYRLAHYLIFSMT